MKFFSMLVLPPSHGSATGTAGSHSSHTCKVMQEHYNTSQTLPRSPGSCLCRHCLVSTGQTRGLLVPEQKSVMPAPHYVLPVYTSPLFKCFLVTRESWPQLPSSQSVFLEGGTLLNLVYIDRAQPVWKCCIKHLLFACDLDRP